jgi:hypothetical protein
MTCLTIPVNVKLAYVDAPDEIIHTHDFGLWVICEADYLDLRILINRDGTVHLNGLDKSEVV